MQIAHFVSQSYNTFRTYGSEPEQLEDLVESFIEVLDRYDIQKITTGFKLWREDNAVMPTPSDIAKLISSTESKITPNDPIESVNDYSNIDEGGREELEAFLKKARQELEKGLSMREQGKPRSHWGIVGARTKEAAQNEMLRSHQEIMQGKKL